MLFTLEGLHKQQLIQINGGAIVSWPVGASKPKTSQLSKGVTTGAGALGGAFWGFLFGLLFFVPIFGLAVGAAIGALMGHFANYGIDQVRAKITPGTSALFLLSSEAVTDRVAEAVKGAAVRDHPDQPVQRARRQASRGLRRVVKSVSLTPLGIEGKARWSCYLQIQQ